MHRILSPINTRDGRVVNTDSIFKTKFKYIEETFTFDMFGYVYYNLDSVINKYEPMHKPYVEGSDLSLEFFNFQLDLSHMNYETEKFIHDSVGNYLENICGYWNVEDLAFGMYLKFNNFNTSGKLTDIPMSYDLIKIIIINNAETQTILDFSLIQNESQYVQRITIEALNSFEFEITNDHTSTAEIFINYITENSNSDIKIKLSRVI